jgi:hypothetical protein
MRAYVAAADAMSLSHTRKNVLAGMPSPSNVSESAVLLKPSCGIPASPATNLPNSTHQTRGRTKVTTDKWRA